MNIRRAQFLLICTFMGMSASMGITVSSSLSGHSATMRETPELHARSIAALSEITERTRRPIDVFDSTATAMSQNRSDAIVTALHDEK